MTRKNRWIRCAGAALVLFTAGCAARPAMNSEEQIRVLEREVARLKSERVNLDARAGALDDKVLLLETRLKKCAGGEARALQVVKLTPEDIASTHEEDATDDVEEEIRINETKGKKKRPMLVLEQAGPSRQAGTSQQTSASQDIPSASRRSVEDFSIPSGFDQLGTDNLGVVLKKDAEPASSQGEMSLFNDAYRDYSNKSSDAALLGFAEFVKTYPDHAFADDAVYWRGECYLAQGKFLYAIGEFERLIRRYPSSDKVPSGMYRIGFAYDKLKDYTKAAEYYFEVVENFPGTDAARRASSRVAEIKNSTPMSGPPIRTSATR